MALEPSAIHVLQGLEISYFRCRKRPVSSRLLLAGPSRQSVSLGWVRARGFCPADTSPQISLSMSSRGLFPHPGQALGHLHPLSLLLRERGCGFIEVTPSVISLCLHPAPWQEVLGLLTHHIAKCPALGSTSPRAAPSSSISACQVPTLVSAVPCPISHSMSEQSWLKPGKRGRVSTMGLWPSGSLPSAVLLPLPRGALLRDGRSCQEEVGADGFPQAQADGRVLRRGRGVRQQEGAVDLVPVE